MKSLALSAALLSVVFFACQKAGQPAKPTPPPSDTTAAIGTKNINFTIAYIDATTTNVEVVISENSGKVLLDTLVPQNSHLTATLKTNAKLVDVTSINYDSSAYGAGYGITTYKAVDPSGWTSNLGGNYALPETNTYSAPFAYILYTNIPSETGFNTGQVYNGISALESQVQSNSPITPGGPNTMEATYQQTPGNYTYSMFYDSKLYNLYIPLSLHDTVAVSSLDTLSTLTFNRSPKYNLITSTLNGVIDSTDISKSVTLYINTPEIKGLLPDVLYPAKGMQAYELTTVWSTSDSQEVSTYGYGSTISPNMVYPDNNNYNITSRQINNFSLTFSGVTPTYYATTWESAKLYYTLYVHPDSTSLNPLGILTNLKSKLLQGQDLTAMKTLYFDFQTLQGYNYQSYLSYLCNPALLKTQHVSSALFYNKTYYPF